MLQKLNSRLELTGSFVALACAVHCITIPVLISIGSIGAVQWMDHLAIEIMFLVLTLTIASWSLISNYRQKLVNAKPLMFFVIGFACLFTSVIFHLHFLSAVGGVLIASAHLINWQQLRKVD